MKQEQVQYRLRLFGLKKGCSSILKGEATFIIIVQSNEIVNTNNSYYSLIMFKYSLIIPVS